MKVIYPDVSIIRTFTDQPQVITHEIYNKLAAEFGRTWICFSSYYLFFEYIGFTKKELALPPCLKNPYLIDTSLLAAIKDREITDSDVAKLDKALADITITAKKHIREGLYSLKDTIKSLIQERETRISEFNGAKELVKAFFGEILKLINEDYDKFIENATWYLSWDVYCSIDPVRLNKKHLRQRQLGEWYQLWESGAELPFGKIIDDQCEYYKGVDSSAASFKNFEDMVDAEMHTSVILGHRHQGKLCKVHALTYPPKGSDAIPERIKLALGSIRNIEATRDIKIEKQFGEVIVLAPESYDILGRHSPQYPIYL